MAQGEEVMIHTQVKRRQVPFGAIDRVVINGHGEALPPRRALEMDIIPTVLFVRNDGWVLGAPTELSEVAESLWKGEWSAKVSIQEER